MKFGYFTLLILASISALVYGLMNQINKDLGWALIYIVLVMFGATSMYLVGVKFFYKLDKKG